MQGSTSRAGRWVARGAAAAAVAAVGYGVATWYRYGRAKPVATGDELLDRVRPRAGVLGDHRDDGELHVGEHVQLQLGIS